MVFTVNNTFSVPQVSPSAKERARYAAGFFLSLRAGLGTWLLAFLLAAPAGAQTQSVTPDSPLPRLLAERKELTRRYAEASAQRHSLFGNKPSKKDLQEVVDALQGIVDKDQEIVDVLNKTAQEAQSTTARLATTTTHLETSSRSDRNLTAQRLYEVQNDLNNLKVRERKQMERLREAEAELAEAQEGRSIRDALIAGLALLSIGLLVARFRSGTGKAARARRTEGRPVGRG